MSITMHVVVSFITEVYIMFLHWISLFIRGLGKGAQDHIPWVLPAEKPVWRKSTPTYHDKYYDDPMDVFAADRAKLKQDWIKVANDLDKVIINEKERN